MSSHLAVALIMGLSAGLQAISGFGFASIATPLVLHLIDAPTTLITLTLVSFLLNLMLIIRNHARLDFRLILPIIVGAVCGFPLGLQVLTTSATTTIQLLVGIVVLGCLPLLWLGHHQLKPHLVTGFGVGILIGFLQLSVGVNGPPLVLYLTGLQLTPVAQRRTLAFLFFSLSLLSLPFFQGYHLLTPQHLSFSLLCIPAVFIGVQIGHYFSTKVSPPAFRRLTFILVLVSGLYSLYSALT